MKNTITRSITPIIGSYFICAKSVDATKGRIIEGMVSMELSKRDFDICPASAFNIKQYMENPQVWYNHQMWNSDGNDIPIGITLELYSITIVPCSPF